jgi:DNA repair protein RecN (Recombination protein N)
MLTELRIRNFAIIESLTLPLAPGFNLLSGETGAGKSIIVGALGLLLGERASGDLIRTGADRAIVEGVFDVTGHVTASAILDDRGIDVENDTVVLRREVSANGRARAWVNGTTVTAGVLAEIGRLLVNLHGQHEAQTLLDVDAQRQILDAFGGATEQASRVRALYDALVTVRRDIQTLETRRADAERRADYLRHVTQEIDAARLVDGEEERLAEEARRLEHTEELRSLAQGMSNVLDGDEDAVLQRLAAVQRALASIQRIDPSLTRLQETFDTAFYGLEELSRELVAYEEGIELDPERLSDVERRRDLIFRLTKKYGPAVGDVLETAQRARAELDLVDSAAFDLRQLTEREHAAAAQLADAAVAWSTLRCAAAGPRRVGRRAIARHARAQNDPGAPRSRADSRVRRGGCRYRRSRRIAGRGDYAARRRTPSGVRDLAPSADRGAGAPPHPRRQGRS